MLVLGRVLTLTLDEPNPVSSLIYHNIFGEIPSIFFLRGGFQEFDPSTSSTWTFLNTFLQTHQSHKSHRFQAPSNAFKSTKKPPSKTCEFFTAPNNTVPIFWNPSHVSTESCSSPIEVLPQDGLQDASRAKRLGCFPWNRFKKKQGFNCKAAASPFYISVL